MAAPPRSRCVALLRGINVGSAKRIAMADLRATLESIGCVGVRTLLNSGNAVFDVRAGTPAGLAKKLRTAILEQRGVDCEVIVKTAADIAAAVAEHPLRAHADDDSKLIVMFTQEPATLAALKLLEQADWAPEAFAAGAHAAWLWCPRGTIDSRLAKAVAKALGTRGTGRNWATLCKIDALARDAA